MSDELKNGIHVLRGLYDTGLNRIATWNKLVPGMQQTAQYLEWMDDTISRAPASVNITTDERLLDYLGKATQIAGIFRSIPDPNEGLTHFVSSSGTAVSSQYYQYVNNVAYRLHDDPQ